MAMISTASKKPIFLLPLVAFLVLLHEVNSSYNTLSFSFSKFDEESAKELVLDGDASISNNVLQLTKVDNNGKPVGYSAGRVSYIEALHLWNESTGLEAAFTTSFEFRITSPGSNAYDPADGLTFFIASSTYPLGTAGGNLGLFGGPVTEFDKVVAVEFDTFINTDIPDPNYRHIGIDINSKLSNITKEWDWVNGDGVQVTITYEPYAKLLRVYAINFSGSKVEFTYDIDLATELHEWARIGFTGSTGGGTQINELINWSFSSELGRRNYVAEERGHIASVV